MTEKSRRKPPESSRSPGERLRRAILDAYELNPAEEALLAQAAEIADVLGKLNRELAGKQALTQKGAKGNFVMTPLLLAQRRHSEVLARLLDAMALPTGDEDEGESPTTLRARRAAQARWARSEKGA